MAFKLGMKFDLCMGYTFMVVSMTLTLMQGHSGSAGKKNQFWIISTTKQAVHIKLAATVGHDNLWEVLAFEQLTSHIERRPTTTETMQSRVIVGDSGLCCGSAFNVWRQLFERPLFVDSNYMGLIRSRVTITSTSVWNRQYPPSWMMVTRTSHARHSFLCTESGQSVSSFRASFWCAKSKDSHFTITLELQLAMTSNETMFPFHW